MSTNTSCTAAKSDGTILVAGGGGYIGSHAVLDLKRLGYRPVIMDNFVTGNRDLAALLDVPICEGDVADRQFLESVFDEFRPVSVMHFAAFAYVGESVTEPRKYYTNNLVKTVQLLDTMIDRRVKQFVFSSTCATYGIPERLPITEDLTQSPINPYGWTKFMIERVLEDYDRAYGLKSIVFRYFNAAGASEEAPIGERHDPETHLIPLAIEAASGGRMLSVFGNDYPTKDGTCVRDYIHVADISQAHILGMKRLAAGGESEIFNIGNGEGYTVREVIDTVEKISGNKVRYEFKPRREGDPPVLVASSEKIRKELGWEPRYPKLSEIINTAYRWYVRDRENLEGLRPTGT